MYWTTLNRLAVLVALLLYGSLLIHAAADTGVKSIFLFKDVLQSNTTALKTSGFDSLVIFRIGVLDNGDLVYYSTGDAGEAVDAPVVTNGAYVGGAALADKIKSFKTGTTYINRVEVSLVSHDTTFQNIRDLINADGPGPDTVLYKNFEILKTEWHLDAFNNDDEGVYDVSSTVEFARLLGAIGYRYSIAPYTNSGFWATVKRDIDAAAPGLFDRVYLQVYDGGAGNNPGSWQTALGIKVIPLLWVVNDAKPSQGVTAGQAQQRFGSWSSQYAVAGGGYWNDYDIEKMGSSYADYAAALAGVFQ
ncbi:coagulation factor 5/8 type domain-containing protein [Colletotrichum graminicola M1.001]|uniref:Coagulation factor 5/8 type domain-containing protein n=1 Tax=Colletotrichum graminicola (strain M1.001 / M2 / FGSC 10212) TaxID=645133 RepID=E3QTH5_COLGM|nr:coagulation factor 5/8 type domain-containing protein [Colletotrichum graminicola M1.001]EFQ34163.1 coagulation factor 5/8 type domain-containing protein [Colletotrichum graminicola M1.001]